MPSLLKGVSIKGFGFNNFLVIGILSLLVVALFLIPEFVGWQRSTVKKEEVKKEAEDEIESVIGPAAVESRVESPLQRLSQMIESGAAKRAGRSAGKSRETKTGSRSRGAGGKLDELGSGISEPGLLLGSPDVSWGDIRSADSVRILKESQKEAAALARDLGSDYPQSRFALFNFSDGITRVLQSNENVMKASEAVNYLNELDSRVTETMIRERVERSDFLKWADISLGPVISQTGAGSMKSRFVPAFNPQLTLTFIRARVLHDDRRLKRPNPTVIVSVRGYVVGKEVKEARLYENDRMVRRLALRRPDDRKRRFFKFGPLAVRGIFSIIAKDRSGEEYRAFYDFKNRVRFFTRGRGGYFNMPFGEVDPRVDSFFRAGGPEGRRSKGNLFESGESAHLVPF